MGWNENADGMEDVLGVTDDIYDAVYEIRNCVRGCSTGCKTYEELAEYMEELGQRLMDTSKGLKYIQDETEEEEDD